MAGGTEWVSLALDEWTGVINIACWFFWSQLCEFQAIDELLSVNSLCGATVDK